MSEVYAFVTDPRNLPRWAAGVGESVELVDGGWVATGSPLGRVGIAFVAPNDLGVADHHVTLPTGSTVDNPMRVIAHDEGAEVVFTLRPRPVMSDVDRDADRVTADLATLAAILA